MLKFISSLEIMSAWLSFWCLKIQLYVSLMLFCVNRHVDYSWSLLHSYWLSCLKHDSWRHRHLDSESDFLSWLYKHHSCQLDLIESSQDLQFFRSEQWCDHYFWQMIIVIKMYENLWSFELAELLELQHQLSVECLFL